MQFTQVHRTEQEKVFISVKNNDTVALTAGLIVKFSATTTNADQGRLVELIENAHDVDVGIVGHVAGVVPATIAIGEVGLVQVYGAADVLFGADTAVGIGVRAGHATDGHAWGASVANDGDNIYSATAQQAVIGTTLEAVDISESTTGSVFLSLM
tara:strand:+ start:1506 stop:1970 length:465 start_codon:yes stop_codon:yes gene_type:complete